MIVDIKLPTELPVRFQIQTTDEMAGEDRLFAFRGDEPFASVLLKDAYNPRAWRFEKTPKLDPGVSFFRLLIQTLLIGEHLETALDTYDL